MKKCMFCCEDFLPKNVASDYCYKEECQKEMNRVKVREYRLRLRREIQCDFCHFPISKKTLIQNLFFNCCPNHKALIKSGKCSTIEDLKNYGKLADTNN